MTHKGFTLIELLIVIAIIAILALIAIPNFLEAQTRAKVARCQSDMRSLGTAIEAFTTDHKYPPTIETWWAPPTPTCYMFKTANWFTKFKQLTSPIAYMTSIPPDVFQEKDKARVRASNGTLVFRELEYLNWQGDFKDPLCYLYETNLEIRWRSGGSKQAFLPMHMDEWQKANANASWMVLSAGPDRDVFTGYRRPYSEDPTFDPAPWGAPAPDDESMQLVPWPLGCYDPSNGSVSWGSIRRTDSPKATN